MNDLEDGLIRLFRLFIGLRLALILVVLVRRFELINDSMPMLAMMSIGISLYLLVHLSSESVRRWFGRAYLPTALIVATVVIVLEQRLLQVQFGLIQINSLTSLLPQAETMVQPPITLMATTAFLFVPLVLVSWQYTFKTVLVYIVGASLIDLITLIVLADMVPSNAIEEMIAIAFRAMSFLIVGYIVSQLMAVKRNQTAALEAANYRLKQYAATQEQLTISRERNRMARELHDTLAHTLSAVTVKLNAVDLIWESDSPKAQRMLGEVIATLDDGLTETRRALRDLRASPLEDMGLLLALEQVAKSAAHRAGATLSLHLTESLPVMSFAKQQGLYRVAQEALENIVRHANARCIEVRLLMRHQHMTLTVRDDGYGFETNAVHNGHFGLQGMMERAQMLGGSLDIQSAKGQGTSIHLSLEVTP